LYRDFSFESKIISTQYKADKVLFQSSAQKVSIDKLGPQDPHHECLDNPKIALIVKPKLPMTLL
jgi:hypothetical protein